MPDQKTMKVRYQKRGEITPGDIVQCPACREKFVVLPGMVSAAIPAIMCRSCGKLTDINFYIGLSKMPKPVELPPLNKKEVKPDGQPGSRKGVSKQRTRKSDGDQAHPKKTRSPRSKGA